MRILATVVSNKEAPCVFVSRMGGVFRVIFDYYERPKVPCDLALVWNDDVYPLSLITDWSSVYDARRTYSDNEPGAGPAAHCGPKKGPRRRGRKPGELSGNKSVGQCAQ